jgi:CheY-like chemotaxis protein
MAEQAHPSRVFVVDDEFVIASTLAMILGTNGFTATPFMRPADALEAATLNPPDLLISDVVMPEMSGIELAIQFRELYPSCKVLLFSGQAATADLLEEARKDGHEFELLLKPIHPKEFLMKIGMVAGKS